MEEFVLDARRMESKSEAHAYLQETMHFPPYYGKNLDALYDCLTELEDTKVSFINVESIRGEYFYKVRRVFRDSARDNSGLILEED